MARNYLRKAALTSKSDASEVRETVAKILADIEAGGDAVAMDHTARFDRYNGPILLSDDEIAAARAGSRNAEGRYPVCA